MQRKILPSRPRAIPSTDKSLCCIKETFRSFLNTIQIIKNKQHVSWENKTIHLTIPLGYVIWLLLYLEIPISSSIHLRSHKSYKCPSKEAKIKYFWRVDIFFYLHYKNLCKFYSELTTLNNYIKPSVSNDSHIILSTFTSQTEDQKISAETLEWNGMEALFSTAMLSNKVWCMFQDYSYS